MSTDSIIRGGPSEPPLLGQGDYDAEGLGRLRLAWTDRGLAWLSLSDEAPPAELGAPPPSADIPETWRRILDRYFAGEDVDPIDIPVDLRGTGFQVRVWEALRKVPRGEVRSYGGIAHDVGSPRGMRAVGAANARNPVAIVVPCHRVVQHGNLLGGYSGGLDKKRFLLRLEGIDVEGDRVLPGQLELL